MRRTLLRFGCDANDREEPIGAKEVTYDFERLMKAENIPAKLLKCSEFGAAVVKWM